MCKAISSISIVILFALNLAGCNNSGGNSAPNANQTDTSGSVASAKVKVNPCGFIYLPDFFFPAEQTDADTMIVNIVGEILGHTGMHLNNQNRNFYLTEASALGNNAVALSQPIITIDSLLMIHRFIVCGPNFIRAISKQCSMAGIYVLLSHEISHHLNGDNFSDSNLPEDRRQAELGADAFAGYLCFQLTVGHHLTLDSCVLIYQIFGDSVDTDTHPNKKARILAFSTGWRTAAEYSKLSCEAMNTIQTNPLSAIQEFSLNDHPFVSSLKSQYLTALNAEAFTSVNQAQDFARGARIDTALIELRGDRSPIVRAPDNELINKEGDTLQSSLQPLNAAGQEFVKTDDYLLDKTNVIWARFPNGLPYVAGYLRKTETGAKPAAGPKK
jgi:hypothetical protein